MADLLYLGFIFIFFAVSWALVLGCERLQED